MRFNVTVSFAVVCLEDVEVFKSLAAYSSALGDWGLPFFPAAGFSQAWQFCSSTRALATVSSRRFRRIRPLLALERGLGAFLET